MRFNDTNNHQMQSAGGGHRYIRAANVTTSAVTIRIFNVPDAGKESIDINAVDADNATCYDRSVPANSERVYPINPRYPVIVYNGTANSISWSMEA